jgi:hypothetical protein
MTYFIYGLFIGVGIGMYIRALFSANGRDDE